MAIRINNTTVIDDSRNIQNIGVATIANTINVGTSGTTLTGIGGSVGIGISTPSQTLHVQGNARVTGAIYDSTNSPGTSG